jgi:Mitochondrial protein up-regulated during meiosis
VRTGFIAAPQPNDNPDLGEEKLVVRWKTEKRNTGGKGNPPEHAAHSSSVAGNKNGSGINRGLSALLGGDKPVFNLTQPNDDFTGIFIFSFDSSGRIATHTIEHADENNGFDKTSKVVTLTDWLLGRARGRKEEEGLVPGLAMRVCREEWARAGRERMRAGRGEGERLW